jgi:hypothetical protein
MSLGYVQLIVDLMLDWVWNTCDQSVGIAGNVPVNLLRQSTTYCVLTKLILILLQ